MMSLADKIKQAKEARANLPPTQFYVLGSKVTEDNVFISKEPVLPNYNDNWINGRRIAVDLPKDLIYEVESFDEHGGVFDSFNDSLNAPLMSKKLITKLRSLGVNNLDTYDASIRFNRTGELNNDFQAVNIIGLVKASDTSQSDSSRSPLSSSDEVSVNTWFDKLVLDESIMTDLLFFRMLEKSTIVLIHTSIKEAIENEFDDLRFYHPLEYSG